MYASLESNKIVVDYAQVRSIPSQRYSPECIKVDILKILSHWNNI